MGIEISLPGKEDDGAIDFSAGNEEVVHFIFFGWFGIADGVGDGRAAGGFGAIHIIQDGGEIIAAQTAVKGDLRGFDFNEADSGFLGENGSGINAGADGADADGLRGLVTLGIAHDQVLDISGRGEQANMHRIHRDGDAGHFGAVSFHAGFDDSIQVQNEDGAGGDDDDDHQDDDGPTDISCPIHGLMFSLLRVFVLSPQIRVFDTV